MKTGMTSLVGSFLSLMYEGRKREANGTPRREMIMSVEGAGCERGSSEWDEAMATRPPGAKKRVSASGSSG